MRTACHLAIGVFVGRVHHVDQQIGVCHLFQRRAERFDQLMRQVPHKANGVADEGLVRPGETQLADRGVQGREQAVLDQNPGVGQGIEERGFACIGVPDKRHRRQPGTAPGFAPRLAGARHVLQLVLQLGDPIEDATAICFELCLAGTPGADASAESAQLGPPAAESR